MIFKAHNEDFPKLSTIIELIKDFYGMSRTYPSFALVPAVNFSLLFPTAVEIRPALPPTPQTTNKTPTNLCESVESFPYVLADQPACTNGTILQ